MRTIVLDCSMLHGRVQAHDYLFQALELPDYYGHNLDALYDCLTEADPCTLVLTGAEALRQQHGYGERVLNTLEDAARDNPSLRLRYEDDRSDALHVRFASESDADALLEVYAPYIDTPVTFEYDCPTPEEFAGRIRDIRTVYPYLVLEEDDRVIGYAYAHRARERTAYDWLAELSIYLDWA